ncbi:MAG TPA: FecR domain-containing protein [Steroidobacteraceae bacterium]|nr:FecR domain-containing protein [Steroidobacteraceae bacterium]
MKVSAEREKAADEAAEWFIANREGLTEAQRVAFDAWLKRSALNVEAYLQATQMAVDLAAITDPQFMLDRLIERARADTQDDNVIELKERARPLKTSAAEAVQARPSPILRWRVAASLAAIGVAGLSFLWWHQSKPGSTAGEETVARFVTRHGEQRSERLADATVVHLNTDTLLTVRYRADRRTIVLERGQAEFDVAHDAARPFHVLAGSAEVIDVGTKFDVYLQMSTTLVTVIEGKVTVGLSPLTGERLSAPVALVAGQQIRVTNSTLPALATNVDVQRATSWLRGEIAFQKEPLAAVAAEFNRYTSIPIEIETPELQQLPISGVFATQDTESFVTFLRSLDGVRVEVTPTQIRVFKP